jgi:hypothetical protein
MVPRLAGGHGPVLSIRRGGGAASESLDVDGKTEP